MQEAGVSCGKRRQAAGAGARPVPAGGGTEHPHRYHAGLYGCRRYAGQSGIYRYGWGPGSQSGGSRLRFADYLWRAAEF